MRRIATCALALGLLGMLSWTGHSRGQPAPERLWQAFDVAELEAGREGRRFLEFLNVPSLSAGLYALPRGATDDQSAHQRDEVYYVVAGRAMLRISEVDQPVGPGSVVFVKRGIEHRFHSVAEDLQVLVLFSSFKQGDG